SPPVESPASGGTPSAGIPVTVTVSDSDANTASASTSITVNNVPPVIPAGGLKLSAATINEGDAVNLTGTFTDPGPLETHTVVINWGDGSADTTLSLGANVLRFSANHPYQNNRPGNAPYTIGVTVTDQDKGSASTSASLTVNNLAPTAQAG